MCQKCHRATVFALVLYIKLVWDKKKLSTSFVLTANKGLALAKPTYLSTEELTSSVLRCSVWCFCFRWEVHYFLSHLLKLWQGYLQGCCNKHLMMCTSLCLSTEPHWLTPKLSTCIVKSCELWAVCPWGQNREFCVAGSHKVITACVTYIFDLETCLMRNAGAN